MGNKSQEEQDAFKQVFSEVIVHMSIYPHNKFNGFTLTHLYDLKDTSRGKKAIYFIGIWQAEGEHGNTNRYGTVNILWYSYNNLSLENINSYMYSELTWYPAITSIIANITRGYSSNHR